eukprot:3530353-Amphidinium_carterae.1
MAKAPEWCYSKQQMCPILHQPRWPATSHLQPDILVLTVPAEILAFFSITHSEMKQKMHAHTHTHTHKISTHILNKSKSISVTLACVIKHTKTHRRKEKP